MRSKFLVNKMPESPGVCPCFSFCSIIHPKNDKYDGDACPVTHGDPERCPYITEAKHD